MELGSIGAKFRLWAITRDYATEVLNFRFCRKAIERDISPDGLSAAKAGPFGIRARMPVKLTSEPHQTWLDASQNLVEWAFSVLRPFPDEPVAFFRVPCRISSPQNDDLGIVGPISKIGS